MAFISLIIQIMIANAKLRFARIAHDRLEYDDFTKVDLSYLTKLSHLGYNSMRIVDRIQWLYFNGFFSFLYAFIVITIGNLILLMLEQIF